MVDRIERLEAEAKRLRTEVDLLGKLAVERVAEQPRKKPR